MPADGPKDAMENSEAAWRSAIAVEHGYDVAVESLLENGDSRLWLLEVSGQEDMIVGPLSWCGGPRMETSGRSDGPDVAFPKVQTKSLPFDSTS
jgi:hypothetical protein